LLYRKLGQTGVDVSILGFGCMRLPLVKSEQKITVSNAEIDEPEATRILRWAIDNGVNYISSNREVVLSPRYPSRFSGLMLVVATTGRR
jgi:predicted aldo/keto reductase-like oxidoreductase